MSRSLSYAAYRALSRRQSRTNEGDAPPRPDGELIWAHANTQHRYSALCDLSLRLAAMRPGLNMLVTVDRDRFMPPEPPLAGCVHVERLASDHPSAMRLFLDHWMPDICLWAGGDLMPNLIRAGQDSGIPMILLDLDEAELQSRRHKWFPDLIRSSLGCFDAVLTTSETAANMLQRSGVPAEQIFVTSRLVNNPPLPACDDADLADVTGTLAARPVWLATQVGASEYDAIMSAYRDAVRRLHRLLLVLTPAPDFDPGDLIRRLGKTGVRHANWDAGDEILDTTQVLVADDDDRGLWYRVAPLCLLGGTLVPGRNPHSPLEAAALGSAILHGPFSDEYADAVSRLANAGALQFVKNAGDLSAAVFDLAAPDRAAGLALAAWQVVTEDADATDRLTDLIQDMLDQRGANHARA